MSLLRRAVPEQEGVLTRHMADHEAATASECPPQVGHLPDKCFAVMAASTALPLTAQ